MAGKDAVSKYLSPEQDDRLAQALRSDDVYKIVLLYTDWDIILPILVKYQLISEKRQEVLKTKTKGDAAAAFPALLTRKKSQALRRGFLLALKESAPAVQNHNMLLTILTRATGVDVKGLEEEQVASELATGALLCVCVRAWCVCVCVLYQHIPRCHGNRAKIYRVNKPARI